VSNDWSGLQPNGMERNVSVGKDIELKGGYFNLSIIFAKAVYEIEKHQPVVLCSGASCKNRMRLFFKIKALN
jgi:hypothetical protein